MAPSWYAPPVWAISHKLPSGKKKEGLPSFQSFIRSSPTCVCLSPSLAWKRDLSTSLEETRPSSLSLSLSLALSRWAHSSPQLERRASMPQWIRIEFRRMCAPSCLPPSFSILISKRKEEPKRRKKAWPRFGAKGREMVETWSPKAGRGRELDGAPKGKENRGGHTDQTRAPQTKCLRFILSLVDCFWHLNFPRLTLIPNCLTAKFHFNSGERGREREREIDCISRDWRKRVLGLDLMPSFYPDTFSDRPRAIEATLSQKKEDSRGATYSMFHN